MLRRSAVRLGLFSDIGVELAKLPAYLRHRAQEQAGKQVESVSKVLEFLKGENLNEDAATREKRLKHREMYQAILREQEKKQSEKRAALKAARKDLPFMKRLQLGLNEAKEAMAQMTSAKAGVMALLQHCTASHAAEIALDQGIDVKDVRMVLEKRPAANAVGHEEVVVGYIDAPSASQEEVMAFAEKLQKACPVANSMSVEWKQGRAEEAPGVTERSGHGDDGPRSSVGFQEFVQNDGTFPRNAGRDPWKDTPAGTPGARRWRQESASTGSRVGFDDGDDDAFHLPGVKRKQQATKAANSDPRASEEAAPGDHSASTATKSEGESGPGAEGSTTEAKSNTDRSTSTPPKE